MDVVRKYDEEMLVKGFLVKLREELGIKEGNGGSGDVDL